MPIIFICRLSCREFDEQYKKQCNLSHGRAISDFRNGSTSVAERDDIASDERFGHQRI